jgi:hypothetical protein
LANTFYQLKYSFSPRKNTLMWCFLKQNDCWTTCRGWTLWLCLFNEESVMMANYFQTSPHQSVPIGHITLFQTKTTRYIFSQPPMSASQLQSFPKQERTFPALILKASVVGQSSNETKRLKDPWPCTLQTKN